MSFIKRHAVSLIFAVPLTALLIMSSLLLVNIDVLTRTNESLLARIERLQDDGAAKAASDEARFSALQSSYDALQNIILLQNGGVTEPDEALEPHDIPLSQAPRSPDAPPEKNSTPAPALKPRQPYTEAISASALPSAEPTDAKIPAEPGQELRDTLKKDDVVEVSVHADKFSDLYGYQFEILYDPSYFEITGALESQIPEIQTIFSKQLDSCALIGATMTGDKSGINGADAAVCKVTLKALKDGALSQITLGRVSVVESDTDYMEGVSGWTIACSVSD